MRPQHATLPPSLRMPQYRSAADDEEGPDWLSMVDQTALGHRLIVDAFGTAALPNVTWQIDPFGHSAMQQQLSSPSAGFGGVTTARIDVQVRAHSGV